MRTYLPRIRARSFRPAAVAVFAGLQVLASGAAAAEATNRLNLPGPQSFSDIGPSLGRVFLALAVVLAVFLGGVWLFRNWQRLVVQRGRTPKLNVLEVRSLGGRHALYVVAFEQERFLIAASPAGVNLVSHLQPATEDPNAKKETPPQPSFAQSLTQMLKGK
jgi:flagellar biogenesis protein FliO